MGLMEQDQPEQINSIPSQKNKKQNGNDQKVFQRSGSFCCSSSKLPYGATLIPTLLILDEEKSDVYLVLKIMSF